jgi:hypothetical protein
MGFVTLESSALSRIGESTPEQLSSPTPALVFRPGSQATG